MTQSGTDLDKIFLKSFISQCVAWSLLYDKKYDIADMSNLWVGVLHQFLTDIDKFITVQKLNNSLEMCLMICYGWP